MMLDPFKPYLRAIEGVAILALIGGLWFGLHHYGNTRYEEGRADDHKGWDADKKQWEDALLRQKTEADRLLSTTIAQNDALRRANDALHAQQEKDYANHRAETDALHVQLSHVRLRFDAGTAPPAGRGQGGGGAVPGTASAPQPAASTFIQLPAEIDRRLHDLAYSADQLKDAYARCVAAVNGGPAL